MSGKTKATTITIKPIRTSTLSEVLVLFTLFYCFSIHSYQALLPAPLRIAFLLAPPVFLSAGLIFLNVIAYPKIRKSVAFFSSVMMLLIMIFWNNHTIKAEGIMGMYGQLMPILFFIAISSKADWYKLLINIMVIMGVFYATWTIICLIYPNMYYNWIAPLMQSLYPNISYNVDAKAGFTAHYSTNGMYLANGLFACISLIVIDRQEQRKENKLLYILLLFIAGAFLICGKRGTLLCVILACYISYFVYQTNKPKGRIFKLIVFSFVLVCLVYVASLVIPSLANAYIRMLAMASRGDISTGRFDLWAAGWKDFLVSPLLGHGWRWFYYYDKSVFAFHDIHNCYLQFLTELGIVGSIPFFTFFFVNMKHTTSLLKQWRRDRTSRLTDRYNRYLIFAILYQSFFLIFIFEGTAFYNPEALIPYMASCAITEYCYYQNKKY